MGVVAIRYQRDERDRNHLASNGTMEGVTWHIVGVVAQCKPGAVRSARDIRPCRTGAPFEDLHPQHLVIYHSLTGHGLRSQRELELVTSTLLNESGVAEGIAGISIVVLREQGNAGRLKSGVTVAPQAAQ